MRLAVISDIHGNLAALEAVLADIKARGVDRTVNLGDCVTSPLWPRETFEALEALSLPTVRGNHDRWIEEFPDDKLSSAGLFARNALTAEQRLALHSLPSQIRLDDGILACHGTPDNDTTCLLEETLDDGRFVPARRDVLAMRLASEPTARVVLCGHSHRQAVTDLMTVWFSIQGAFVARSSQTFPLPQTWNTARRTRDMQSSRSDKGAGRPNSWPSNTIGTPHRPVPSPTTTRNGRGPYRRDMSNSCWHRSTQIEPHGRTGEHMADGISLADKLATFGDFWSPRTITTFNDCDVMVVKVKGEFTWHKHDDTDDFFLVLKGSLEIELRDRTVTLGPGELYVVPKGVEHRPVAREEVHLLLIEPTGTPNTGDKATAADRKLA